MRVELLNVRGAGWAIAASLVAAACTPLNMTAPETGDGGRGGGTAGTGGTGGLGVAGTTGSGGTGVAGTTGSGGTGVAGTTGSGGLGVAGTTGSGGTGGASGGSGSGGAIVEPAGLIAFWRFNENNGSSVADSSGNNQNLMLSTGGAWTTGHEGAAMAFDGANDLAGIMPLDSQQLAMFPTVPLTFSAWVRPAASAASRPFATAVARSHEDYAFQDFWLGLINGRPACTIHSPSQEGAVASVAATAGAWTHIACTYGLSGDITLYVNGASASASASSQNLGPIKTAILVGASETGVGPANVRDQFFPGSIDDVRIYKATLTAAEVASIAR